MKSRRIMTILLSLAIMLSFMPTMAFAMPDANGHEWNTGAWLVQPDKCGEVGVWQQTCKRSDGYEEVKCTDVKNTAKVKAHKAVKDIMTPAAFVEKLMAQGYFEYAGVNATKTAAAVAKTLGKAYCQLEVYVCDDCGKLCTARGEIVVGDADDGTNDANYWCFVTQDGKIAHVADVACAAVPTCKNCGGAMNPSSTARAVHETYCDSAGLPLDGFTVATSNGLCKNGDSLGSMESKVYTHTKCGEMVAAVYKTIGTPKHNLGTPVSGVNPQATGSDGYIWVNEKAYNPNRTYVDAAGNTYSYLVCEECGLPVDTDEVGDQVELLIPNFKDNNDNQLFATAIVSAAVCAHNWTLIHVPASCTTSEMSFELCSKCYDTRNIVTKQGSILKHDYAEKAMSTADCTNDGITIMKCKRCGHEEQLVFSGEGQNVTERNKKTYFKYVNGEVNPATGAETDKYIEFTDPRNANPGHVWSAYETVAEPNCIHGTLQAKKCKNCGAYDAHSVKATGKANGHTAVGKTQNPTCGAEGFDYNICSVCGTRLDKAGRGPENPNYDGVLTWNKTKPVVAYGTECQHEWKVLEAATIFKQGTKAKVCPVCGDIERATKESIAKVTYTAAKAFKATAGKKKITVKVKAQTDAVKYVVKCGTKKKTVTSAKSVTFKSLKSGKKYAVKVIAYNADGQKVTSKAKKVKAK